MEAAKGNRESGSVPYSTERWFILSSNEFMNYWITYEQYFTDKWQTTRPQSHVNSFPLSPT